MNASPACPSCQSIDTYSDGNLWICPLCAHEWSPEANASVPKEGTQREPEDGAVRDAHGNVLQDGDSVTVLKELKVKGSSLVVKGGTKVRNIRLVLSPNDGHNISCKIDGVGSMNLKSEFVKKA